MKMFKSQSIVLNYYIYWTKSRQIIQSEKQLIIALRREHNLYKIRYQLSTTHLNYEIRMLLILTLTYILHRRFLIFDYYMILIRQLSKTSKMVIFILFCYMVLLNIFCLTLKISKSYYVIWLTILRIRILIAPRQMIYRISIAWIKWPRTLFLQYMN